ncbi:MAG: helix-turn-helix domain-containing protein [Deltaproteobacteria bacterium]|jgi:transposase|nr:helix-turn-helix domain-containing protein [Deltaproteobacteria bacterium]
MAGAGREPLILSQKEKNALLNWVEEASQDPKLAKLANRARVILLRAEGHSNAEIGRSLGLNPVTVAKWRERYREGGIESLHDFAPYIWAPSPREMARRVAEYVWGDKGPPPPALPSAPAKTRSPGRAKPYKGETPVLSDEDRETLREWTSPREMGSRIAKRASVALLCAEGLSDAEIARRLAISNATAAKWRARFLKGGIEELLDSPPPAPAAPRRAPVLEDEEPDLPQLIFAGLFLDDFQKAIVFAVDSRPDQETRGPVPAHVLTGSPEFARDLARYRDKSGKVSLLDSLTAATAAKIRPVAEEGPRASLFFFLERLGARWPRDAAFHVILDREPPDGSLDGWLDIHDNCLFHIVETPTRWRSRTRYFLRAFMEEPRRGARAKIVSLLDAIKKFEKAPGEAREPFIWLRGAASDG